MVWHAAAEQGAAAVRELVEECRPAAAAALGRVAGRAVEFARGHWQDRAADAYRRLAASADLAELLLASDVAGRLPTAVPTQVVNDLDRLAELVPEEGST